MVGSLLCIGGIYFHLLGHSETVSSLSKQTSVYLVLQDQPNSFGSILHYYKQWISTFFAKNSITSVISGAMFGVPIQFTFLFGNSL